MDIAWITLRSELPQCTGTDAQGRRCCEPVVWDQVTARPISTRCQAHGGLADGALMGWQSPDLTEMPSKVCTGIGTASILANSLKTLRTKWFGRAPGSLPALALAGALCLSMAGPALADFESAVVAYEGEAYQEAQAEFEILAAAGDQRAEPFLEKLRRKISSENQEGGSIASPPGDEEQADESLMSTISETVTSILSVPDSPRVDSESESTTRDTGSFFTGLSTESAPGGKPTDWEPWSPFDQAPEPAPPPSPVSDVVSPQRGSIWSAIFHLPGDATVIGLQYAARLLDADNLSRELQFIGRHSDKIALSILAGFWWLVIIRGVVGIAVGLSRFMKAATTITEQKRYG